MGLLNGKTVLVTGASKGIGKSISELFAKEGANLVLFSRNADALRSLADSIKKDYAVEVHFWPGDIRKYESIKSLFVNLAAKEIFIDVLVNNAGIMIDSTLQMAKEETVQDVFATNVFGSMYCSQLALKSFLRKRKGSIINMSSIIGTNGNLGQSIYSSSKSAIIGFTKSLSKELAPLNIRVNAIAPGFIDTDMTRGMSEKFYEKNIASIGMKRIGTPEDVKGGTLPGIRPLRIHYRTNNWGRRRNDYIILNICMGKYIDFDIDKGFPLFDLKLSDIAGFVKGTLVGPDQPVNYLARLKVNRKNQDHFLSYVTNEKYWEDFINSHHNAAIIDQKIFKGKDLKNGKSVILVSKPADYVFFTLQEYLAVNNFYAGLKSYVGTNCSIHQSAQIYEGVVIKDRVNIGPNVVLYPNTVINNDCNIKANTVIGGTGFEFKYLNGRKKIVSHSGGVYIGENVEIGSLTAIDRDMLGYFTIVMDGTKIDNLVHIAHNAFIGEECSIIASSEIAGSVKFGKGVWYSANACCNPELEFGDYSFVGTGAFVGNNIPSFAQVLGNPARQIAWICKCHKHKLDFLDNYAKCVCGREYKKEADIVSLLSDIFIQI